MTNNRAIGRHNELRTKRWYESQGFIVQLAPTSRKWQNSQDYWGLMDGMALREDKLVWFQVKTARKPPLQSFIVFATKYAQHVDVVVVKHGGGAKIYHVQPLGTVYIESTPFKHVD